jgi:hypothetical protein
MLAYEKYITTFLISKSSRTRYISKVVATISEGSFKYSRKKLKETLNY